MNELDPTARQPRPDAAPARAPQGLPTAMPQDAGELRRLLAEAVEVLPALPPPDRADRYACRNLTVLWLEGQNSHHTRRTYYRALCSWLGFCARTALDPLRARRADVDAWINMQTVTVRDGTTRPAKPNTKAQLKAAVTS